MAVNDWIRFSISKIQEEGASGAKEAFLEAIRSGRRRVRKFHFLTPEKRTICISGTNIEIKQTTGAEWDHIQAIRNESPVIKDAIERTRSDDIFWDVGANVGAWSCFLGKAGAEIIAFEPIQANQKALLDNLRRNNLEAQVVPRALSDKTGDVVMHLDSRGATAGAGRASLLRSWRGSGESAILVPEVQGADLEKISDPTVLKIDVEGAEVQVLRGLGERLSNVRLAYVEVHNSDVDEIYKILSDSGLTVTASADDTGCGVLRAERV